MSDSQANLRRIEDSRRFGGPRGASDAALFCAACKREMYERWAGMWYADEHRMDDEPLDAPHGEKCCSTSCLSQYVYDTAPEDVKSLMRSLAQVVNQWSESVRLRRSDRSLNMDWAVRHSYLTHLMPRLNLEVADDAMEDFAESLIGRDAAIGADDGPKWYQNAVDEHARILSTLKAVYEWADNREDITETGHPNSAMEVKGMIHDQLDDLIYREWKPDALKPAQPAEFVHLGIGGGM